MMVANAFDMWQKDAFFSAAEEVQESADVMESTYREWNRARSEAPSSQDLIYLSRDLQTALGTAKWQLEEFEKAVRVSHGYLGDKNTTTRHDQFIAAIRSQISRVEVELQESISEGGNQPLRWVNLDKDERDDLALFLSGMASPSVYAAKAEFIERGTPKKRSGNSGSDECRKKDDAESSGYSACSRGILDDCKGFKDGKSNEGKNYVKEREAKEILGTREDMNCTGARRTWSSPNIGGDWKIVIADEDEERNHLLLNSEATPKDKAAKGLFSKRCGERPQAKLATAFFNQVFGRVNLHQRQSLSPRHLLFGRSLQVMLVLMLTIFLIVPFVFYSM